MSEVSDIFIVCEALAWLPDAVLLMIGLTRPVVLMRLVPHTDSMPPCTIAVGGNLMRTTRPASGRRWRLWQLETSMACQLRCAMCPWQETRERIGEALMPDTVWESLRPHLREVALVDFSGGGEPLLHPKLPERIAQATEAGCSAGFLSNGMLLDEVTCRALLEAGVDWVACSLDGADAEVFERVRAGASFATVTRNIRRLTSLRTGGTPRVIVNFLMMPINAHQMIDLVRLAHELGVDQVNFKQCDVVRGKHGRGFGLFAETRTKEQRRLERAVARARRLARRLEIETTAFALVPEELPVCAQDPRSSLFVRYDGRVAPCIQQAYGGETVFLGHPAKTPTVHYGALPRTDLLEVWEGATCRSVRRTFQSRVEIFEAQLMRSVGVSSMFELRRMLASATRAMPEPPVGCRTCHYLYNI